MNNHQITLNDLVAKAGVTAPMLSAQDVCGNARDITSIISSQRGRIVVELTQSFTSECLEGSAGSIEVFPVLSEFSARDYALVFGNDFDRFFRADRFRTRGMCDPLERSIVLWKPCTSVREFYHEVCYRDAEVDATALIRVGAPYRARGGFVSLYVYCTIVISTPFQKAIERILNNLCAFARGEASFVWEGARRVLLATQLREVGLEDSLDDLISLVRSNNDNWFNVLCSILCLRQEERRYLSQAWLSALHREKEIELPYVARHTFGLSRPEEARGVAWMHRDSDIGVFSRYSDVSDFGAGLLCVPDLAMFRKLFTQLESACKPLHDDKEIWRYLADQTVLANLNRQNGPFKIPRVVV